jgi:hypothetical protein
LFFFFFFCDYFSAADFAIHTITAIQDESELNRFAASNVEQSAINPSNAQSGKSFSISINEVESILFCHDFFFFLTCFLLDQEEHRPLLLDSLVEEDALIQQNLELGEFSQPFLIQFVYLALRSLKNSWRSKVLLVQ